MTGEPQQRPERALRRRALNEKLRRAFVEGAEERSQRELGRPLTTEELRRILPRYPGDLPERWRRAGDIRAARGRH
jgi:hypothetical protein